MGKDTSIAWTDHTFNPWHGCTKVSPGCDNCYAESVDAHYTEGHWGTGVARRTFGLKHWLKPGQWDREAAAHGVIRKVFTLSMGDYNDPEAPAEERERLHEVIDQTPNLLWQILTKRPHLYGRHLPHNGFLHDNVILGATTEDQKYYDERIGPLNEAAALLSHRNHYGSGGISALRERKHVQTFVSYEPALGALTMDGRPRPDWLIFGGETGAADKRRSMEQVWAEDIKAECERANVAFFMKQMSAKNPKQAAQLIPAHLLLRQFPGVPA